MKSEDVVRQKRTQQDYNLGFKLRLVSQVEKGELTYKQAQKAYGIQGRSTVLVWLRKHGNLDWKTSIDNTMTIQKQKESPAQRIKRLEKALEDEKIKNMILNKMIDISDKQYGTSIRKKFSPKQSKNSRCKSN